MRALMMVMAAGLVCAAGASGQTGEGQKRYETVFYPSGKLKIEAYVYKPEGEGPFAVVIYNHGSRPGRERVEMPFFYVGTMLSNAKDRTARLSSGAKARLEKARYAGAGRSGLLKKEVGDGEMNSPLYVSATEVMSQPCHDPSIPQNRPGRYGRSRRIIRDAQGADDRLALLAPITHGQEGTKGPTTNGYVVVVPERRGYGRSDGKLFSEEIGDDRGPRYVRRLQDEADDVIAAAEFARTLPYVDGTRTGVMGWSFGGIVSVFAAASGGGTFRVAVDQAGGALTWDGSPDLQRALKEAAAKIRVPLLAMVAENDRTTESVKAVAREAERHGGNAKLIVYPAFIPRATPNGIAPGHMIFGVEGAPIWEADVKEFLAKYLSGGRR